MLLRMLENFYREYDLGSPPEKNEVGIYDIPITDQITVQMKALDPGLYFQSNLLPPATERKEEFYIYLMRANFLGQGTGGSVIGLDFEEKNLTLCLSINYEINYLEFKEKLEDFINYTDYWRKEIKKFKEMKSFL